jgi:hypothetical protein
VRRTRSDFLWQCDLDDYLDDRDDDLGGGDGNDPPRLVVDRRRMGVSRNGAGCRCVHEDHYYSRATCYEDVERDHPPTRIWTSCVDETWQEEANPTRIVFDYSVDRPLVRYAYQYTVDHYS